MVARSGQMVAPCGPGEAQLQVGAGGLVDTRAGTGWKGGWKERVVLARRSRGMMRPGEAQREAGGRRGRGLGTR